ncbi:hypothetical protein BpHYR1_052505 [Brachionus plicatilis]|uniref:Uncharacterized protein n=1 Tax=Brachionus plicatilis TaxID=10195 RepID=A0A3M7SWL8_BRAPC|nr:hypothetical protein BpHYR1_052505 [Brachionus plicatilis]
MFGRNLKLPKSKSSLISELTCGQDEVDQEVEQDPSSYKEGDLVLKNVGTFNPGLSKIPTRRFGGPRANCYGNWSLLKTPSILSKKELMPPVAIYFALRTYSGGPWKFQNTLLAKHLSKCVGILSRMEQILLSFYKTIRNKYFKLYLKYHPDKRNYDGKSMKLKITAYKKLKKT